jgi:hypothetical protein
MTRTRQWSFLGVALALIVAGALSGCVGSHGAAKPAAYIAAGNAICRGQLARLGHVRQPTSTEEAISYLPSALGVLRADSRELASLDVPAAQRGKLDAALASSREMAALLTRFLHELNRGMVEFGQLAALQAKASRLRARIDLRFHEAGLSACHS